MRFSGAYHPDPVPIGALSRHLQFAFVSCFRKMRPNTKRRFYTHLQRLSWYLALLAIGLPAVYVLSIGPAVALLKAKILPESCGLFWEPLRPLCDGRKPLGKALLRYQTWWIGAEYVEPPEH